MPFASVFEAKGLRAGYGAREIVLGADLAILPGEIVMVTGANGCGKTTLLDAICGFLPHEATSIALRGKSILELKAVRRAEIGLGRLFQRGGVFRSLSVWQHLEIAIQGRRSGSLLRMVRGRRPSSSLKTRLSGVSRDLIDAAGIGMFDDRLAEQLSFGQKRVLAMACVAARNSSLLLLDEPYVGLDPAGRAAVRRALTHFSREGRAVLVVEHELSELEAASSRVLYMRGGGLSPGTAADWRD